MWTEKDDEAIKQIVENQMTYLKALSNDEKKRVQEVLTLGMSNGWSISKIQKEMTSKVKSLSETRGEMIARSEIVKAHNIGMINTMKEAGIKKYQWITAKDNKVCPKCRALDGKTFDVGKGPLPVYSTHPNCRCSIIAL